MTAEIIAVGTELLLGDILNTNAQFLSQQLAQLGVTVHFQSVVGDNPARLESVVRLAMQRSDLLVFSGGLGPTDDDLTKQTVARAFEDELRLDGEELARIRAFFTAWGRTMPPNNEKQAYVPVRGRKLHNANGTAPGMLFEAKAGGKWAVLLPGPPAELQPMFLNEVRPWLAGLTNCALHSLTLRVAGIGESHLEGKVAHLLSGENPTAALYAKTGEVFIRITAKARDAAAAAAMCRALAGEFYAVLGDAVYGEDGETLAAAVVHALQKTGATAATAESCTGGLVSAALTDVPGASEVFGFGACTYSNGSTAPFQPRRPPKGLGACAAPPGQTSASASPALPGRAAAQKKSPWGLYFWPRHAKIRCMCKGFSLKTARGTPCAGFRPNTRWRCCGGWRFPCRSRGARRSRAARPRIWAAQGRRATPDRNVQILVWRTLLWIKMWKNS